MWFAHLRRPTTTLPAMLKSFLLISIRNILNNKGSAYLNIFGLAVGMAACLFLFNYIRYELTYDSFPGSGDLFRVETHSTAGDNPNLKNALTTPTVGDRLKQGSKEIVLSTRLMPYSENRDAFFELAGSDSVRSVVFIENVYYSESSFFDLFSVPLLAGEYKTALSEPNTIVLSESVAQRIFSREYASGATVIGRHLVAGPTKESIRVTGVMQDRPDNTHLKIGALLSLASPEAGMSNPGVLKEENTYTYVAMPSDRAEGSLIGESALTTQQGDGRQFFLRPLGDIHLSSGISNETEKGADIQLLVFLGLIGLIILALACTNYVNNAIISSIDRAKEIGIRKLLGSKPSALGLTFVGEAFLLNLFAGLLAFSGFLIGLRMILVYSEIAYPSLGNSDSASQVVFSVVLLVVTTLCSAIYPAIYLSSLKPTDALKGKVSVLNSSQSGQGNQVIRLLLVLQLATSIGFVSAVYMVYEQLSHLKEYDKEPIELEVKGVFPGLSGANSILTRKVNTLIDEALRFSYFTDIQLSNLHNGRIKTQQAVASIGENEEVADSLKRRFMLHVIDHKYWKDSTAIFLAGKNFDPAFGEDYNSVIINETAMRELGFAQPDSTVGLELESKEGKLKLTGIVKNRTAEENAGLYVTGYRYPTFVTMSLNVPGRTGEAINNHLKKIEHMLSQELDGFYFLSRGFDNQTTVEQNMLKLFFFFSLLAILIANMGMFGLASFITQKRAREIGIRKILGASTWIILLTLLFDLLKLVVAGVLLAAPIVFYFGRKWLEGYPYRISLEPRIILLPVLAVLLIVASVTGKKCWDTASKSPLGDLD